MCDRVVSKDAFLTVYCTDKYKTQRMCNKAVDNTIGALKLISDGLVRSKIFKKLCTVLYGD